MNKLSVLGLLAGVVLVGIIATLLGWAFIEGRAELQEEGKMEQPIKAPPHLAVTPSGDVVVTLDLSAQHLIALQTELLKRTTLQPTVVAYGVLQPDPMLSFTVRAPIRGILYAAGAGGPADWPDLGARLSDGMVIGVLHPLLSAVDRVDLASRLAQARAKVVEHRALLEAAQSSLEHKEALNAQVQVLPQRTLEALAAEVKSEKAQIEAARRTASVIESALAISQTHRLESGVTGVASSADDVLPPHLDVPISTMPVQVTRGGEVVELRARPGEVVSQGQAILRVARFDHLVARMELPAGDSLPTTARTARIVALGHEDHPLVGQAMGPAPRVQSNTQGQAFLFRVNRQGLAIRPGLAVTGYIELPGEPLAGVVIPREAVIRSAGRAWVFVQVSQDRFVQRAIALDHPTQRGWFTQSGFSVGQRVVTTGAQMLLSEILKSQIRVGEEEERQ